MWPISQRLQAEWLRAWVRERVGGWEEDSLAKGQPGWPIKLGSATRTALRTRILQRYSSRARWSFSAAELACVNTDAQASTTECTKAATRGQTEALCGIPCRFLRRARHQPRHWAELTHHPAHQ